MGKYDSFILALYYITKTGDFIVAIDIILDGNQVNVEAHDIILHFKDRRKSKRGQQRVLVHGFDGGLTIN